MNVRTEQGKIIITVDKGYHEIYIDEKISPPWLQDGQTGEYQAEPGPHRVGVRKDGTWAYDETVIVSGETDTKPEQPEEPTPEAYVSIKASIISDLIAEIRDIAALLEALTISQGAE